MAAENETASPREVPPKALVMAVQIIDNVVGRGSGLLFAGLVLPMVGGLCYEVFARYLFNAPTIWAYDVTYMLYGSHFMLGAAYTLYKGSHIRTDMLYENFTLRWKGRVDASMYLVFFLPGDALLHARRLGRGHARVGHRRAIGRQPVAADHLSLQNGRGRLRGVADHPRGLGVPQERLCRH